ncbi:MAG: hypothetical protein ACK4R2_06035 [Roseateles sp.]
MTSRPLDAAPRLPAQLKADCSACVALCCVVPPFDAVQGFGFDKPAETPCQHLCADHRCGIHAELMDRGFAGCIAFDCLGAGQRLTAQAVERFGSADWRARPEVARWLFAAYPRVRQAQEWLARLTLAATVTGRPELQALADALEAEAPHWADWQAAQQAQWQARVRAALVLLAQNPGPTTRN